MKLLMLILILGLLASSCTTVRTYEDPSIRHYCEENQRAPSICAALDSTVCGWFNEKVGCDEPPCNQDYLSACESCLDSQIEYWTDGPCNWTQV